MSDVIAWEDLSAGGVDKRLLEIRATQTCLTWELASGLYALECRGQGACEELGFSSLLRYAFVKLSVHPLKFRELLRAYKVLLSAPIMAEAFRSGALCWSKVRELTRHVTSATDEALTEVGKRKTTEQIAKLYSISGREFRKQRAEGRRTRPGPAPSDSQDQSPTPAAQPEASSEARNSSAPEHTSSAPDNNSSDSSEASSSQGDAGIAGQCDLFGDSDPERPAATSQPSPACAPSASTVTSPVDPASVGSSPSEPAVPAGPQTVNLVVRMTPDQYALYEQAMFKATAGGRRMSAAAVIEILCVRYLSTGSAQSNLRHMVHVHVDEATGEK